MHIKKAILLAGLMVVCSLGYTHEFWLEPVRFLLKQGDRIRVDLLVGEDYTGEHSNGNRYKIVRLVHYDRNGSADIRERVHGDSLSSFDLVLGTSGSHLISFNNTSKFIELEAGKFNDYLRSEGLDDVAQSRLRTGDTLKSGRELYQRCVKTLLQAGTKTDKTFAINTGLPLEIIPVKNPYSITATEDIAFRVLFRDAPLTGALVLAWHNQNGITTHTSLRTDESGIAHFPISRKGKWMISTVHMTPSDQPADADWQSYWGSYTFGYY